MTSFSRLPVAPLPVPGNAGIVCRYPLDEAVWIWHPVSGSEPSGMVEFRLVWTQSDSEPIAFDVSADQRFVLTVDGQEVGRGPDRAELQGWSFHRYGGELKAGEHEIRVLCWWWPEGQRPCAQVSSCPGFALKGLEGMERVLSTGEASWEVRSLPGISPLRHPGKLGYHVIGCPFQLDGSVVEGPWCTPEVAVKTECNPYGLLRSPWRLEPSPLPEQRRERVSGGTIRWSVSGLQDCCQGDGNGDAWSALVNGEALEIPPHSERTWFWDFEGYVCGYPEIKVSGGAGSRVEMEWAESLYESPEPTASSGKGNRGACEGKHWLGFGDVVLHAGGDRTYRVPWWRSGRWVRLVVKTGDEALILRDIRPLSTGYPFERAWAFSTDQDVSPMLEICEAGLRNCVHETFVDCPYYEQLMYLGDTRSQVLSWMVASGDMRPVQRALELFDRSRWVNGFHAERCPADVPQMSATYSLVYPPLLRDAAWWGLNPDVVRRCLPGMRSALEHALGTLDSEGLPRDLPGWLFVDWVDHPDWELGAPVDQKQDITSPVALHLPVALDAAAQVEEGFGDPLMAERWRRRSQEVMAAIVNVFWAEDQGCLADNRAQTRFSEHAQALALACDSLPEEYREDLVARLLVPPKDWAKASVYFSIHVHEALLQAGHGEAVWERFGFWKGLTAQGFMTTVEKPEPSRSDCHGWGAHPLYHCLSGFAGIRPAAPGFQRVRIDPCPGPLTRMTARVPHPLGEIRLEWTTSGGNITVQGSSPVPGELCWHGECHAFQAGDFHLTGLQATKDPVETMDPPSGDKVSGTE